MRHSSDDLAVRRCPSLYGNRAHSIVWQPHLDNSWYAHLNCDICVSFGRYPNTTKNIEFVFCTFFFPWVNKGPVYSQIWLLVYFCCLCETTLNALSELFWSWIYKSIKLHAHTYTRDQVSGITLGSRWALYEMVEHRSESAFRLNISVNSSLVSVPKIEYFPTSSSPSLIHVTQVWSRLATQVCFVF